MHEIIDFLLQHGYVVILGWVFAEQVGIPIPSMPLLLAAGALAGTRDLNVFSALAVAVVAAVAADLLWFNLGRRRGIQILQLLCRISLEPSSCVRRTQGVYAREGAKSLLVAKFVPGLNTVAPPLAGIIRMPLQKFLLFDTLGSILWAGGTLGVGFLFSDQIEIVLAHAERLGRGLVVVVAAIFGLYIAWKFLARRKFLHDLRVARISPEELKERMDRGDEMSIVDLRHAAEFDSDPETIPGAFRMDAEELEAGSDKLPHDREVILFCT
jgi:membrane protein DedA with SNARE-associated domain